MAARTRLPSTPEEITAAWLSEVFARRHPGAEASSVEVIDAHSGTTGRARLRVEWRTPGSAPSALFAKLAPADPIQREMVVATGMGLREARFYATLADQVPVRVPRSHWAGWNEDGSAYLMLLEDLVEAGCRFPSSKGTGGDLHAPAMMDTLAALHARYWDAPALRDTLAWIEAPMRGAIGPLLVRSALEQFGAEMPPAFAETAGIYLNHTEALCDRLDRGPQTLVHGDAHLGNTFHDGQRIGLLDWACTARAPGLRDVSYFVCSSLSIDFRRRAERDLLRRYLERLAAAGGPILSFEAAWRQHRRFAVCAWIAAAATAGAGSRMQSVAIGRRALARATAAIVDLDTPGLLREDLCV